MSKYPLYQSVTATFEDDGTGEDTICRAFLGPTVYGTSWRVTSIATTTTNNVSEGGKSSQLIVYQDFESPSSQLFGSYNAENDVATGEYEIVTLSKLIFVWRHGSIGSFATAIVRGDIVDQRP